MVDASKGPESTRSTLDPTSGTNWWLVFLFTAITGPLSGLTLGLGQTWAPWIDTHFATGERWSQIHATGFSVILGIVLIFLVLKAFHLSLDGEPIATPVAPATPLPSSPSDVAATREAELVEHLEHLIDTMDRQRWSAFHWAYLVGAMITVLVVGDTVSQAIGVDPTSGLFKVAAVVLVVAGERALGELLSDFGHRRLPA